jgi:hypothetical protein
MNNNSNQLLEQKEEKGILKAIGSILIAIVASSHHWLHTLLIALGLTSLGTGLLSLPPWIKIGFMLFSFFISIMMLRVAKRKWNHHRSVSWVYLISSILSIIIVLASMLQVFTNNNPSQQNHDQQVEHQQHHNN